MVYGYKYFKEKNNYQKGEFVASVVAMVLFAIVMIAVLFLFTLTN